MPLSIGVSGGDRISVGGTLVEVKSTVTSAKLIIISVDGGEDVVVNEKSRVQVHPDVCVAFGIGRGHGNRLMFEPADPFTEAGKQRFRAVPIVRDEETDDHRPEHPAAATG